ncbi:MAG: LuxR C-terminal-related transcriptional regulator [Oscillospiraceae bacterium]
MTVKEKPKRKLCISARLRSQLEQIAVYPLTVIEAPAGFGKTTAVRELLTDMRDGGAQVHWYTCMGEPAQTAWAGICGLFEKIGGEGVQGLKNLEMPNMETLICIMSLMREVRCAVETYLVIDNFHLADCEIPRELMSVFAMHECPRLHIIFITQQLHARQKLPVGSADIHVVGASAFFFDRAGIRALFKLEGIRLTDDEVERVFMSTDGWVSAIRLVAMSWQYGGADCAADIEQLVENAIWNRLSQEEQEFLVAVSVLDGFRPAQAAAIVGAEVLPQPLERLLKSMDFIRFFPEQGVYSIHSILREYLLSRFRDYTDAKTKRLILTRAAQSHAAAGEYSAAMRFYFRLGAFDALLSLPFDSVYLADHRESRMADFFTEVLRACPEAVLSRYPFRLITVAYLMLFEGRHEAFSNLLKQIDDAITQNTAGLSADEHRQARGEYELLLTYADYNDLTGMNKATRAASDVLQAPSRIMVKTMPCTYGGTSLLSMFWSKPGKLTEITAAFSRHLAAYMELTEGHCAGADSVLTAEAELVRGDDAAAEVFCHKAIYEAGAHHQTEIIICALQVLARIQILRGDAASFLETLGRVKQYADGDFPLCTRRMAELSACVLNMLIGTDDNIPVWFGSLESIEGTLYAPTIPYAQAVYAQFLVTTRQYNVLFGVAERFLKDARRHRYLVPQIYLNLALSQAKQSTGSPAHARELLIQALTLALPDRAYLYLAQQEGMEDALNALPASFFKDFDTNYGASARGRLSELKALCHRQVKGANTVRKAICSARSPLTPREREIALLTRDRLSAKEISARLFIAEATVRTIIKNIYSKLDIHSKSELEDQNI